MRRAPAFTGAAFTIVGFVFHCACSPSQPADPVAKWAGSGASGGSSGAAGTAGSPSSPIPSDATELVTVISASWSSVPATLHRYESSSGGWSAIGAAVSVVLGKNGLGWGIGLHPPGASGDPTKHEGDGRSPAGIFTLGTAFGYAPPDAATWLKMPYLEATDDLECVDDPASSHYNQLLYRSTIANVDWQSSELMKRPDLLYRWGLFVEHNSHPPQAGAGSCIFLHTWSSASSSTSGCTAGDETEMKEIYAWLDPQKHPVLVQLPQAIYDAHRGDWVLP
jgi:D-alanyl-D-alanine dipeptidase